jgi:hypothetical protein
MDGFVYILTNPNRESAVSLALLSIPMKMSNIINLKLARNLPPPFAEEVSSTIATPIKKELNP